MDTAQIAVLDLRTPAATPKILVRGGSQAQYAASGHLVYVAGGGLRAIAFDLSRLETVGSSIPVVPNVTALATGTAEFDVSRDGTLIYVTGASSSNARTLVWVDRQGREEPVKAAPARAYTYPRLSPDGTRIAVDIRDQDNDVWVWHLAGQTMTRVTSDPGLDQAPVWLSDTALAFTSQISGYRRRSSNEMRRSRPTAAGWPTTPTIRPNTRYRCGRSPTRSHSAGRSRPPGDRNRFGREAATSCSTCRSMARS
jgi:serine/threonine-protein kinase